MSVLQQWRKGLTRLTMAVVLGVGTLSVTTADAMTVSDVMGTQFSQAQDSQAFLRALPKGTEAFVLNDSNLYKGSKAEAALQVEWLKATQPTDAALQAFVTRQERFMKEPPVAYYQLQGTTKEGIQTAHVVVGKVLPDGPWAKDYKATRQDAGLWQGIAAMLTVATPNVLADVNRGLEGLQQGDVLAHLTVRDLETPQVLKGDSHYGLTVGGRASLDINGFELPMYVKGAVIGTEQEPTFLLLITSDVERQYFSPVVDHVVKNYK